MTKIASTNLGKELNGNQVSARRNQPPVHQIGGSMDGRIGDEMNEYSVVNVSRPDQLITPRAQELSRQTERLRIPLSAQGEVSGIGRISSVQAYYEQPSGKTKVPDAIAEDLLGVNFDLVNAITSDIKSDVAKVSKIGIKALLKGVFDFFTINIQSVKESVTSWMKPAKQEKQKTAVEVKAEALKIEHNFVRQKTAGTEQMISTEAKKKMQEATIGLAGENYSIRQSKDKGYAEAYRFNTASGIATERSEKIAAQKRKRYSSGIGSPAKRAGRAGGVSSSGAKSDMLRAAEDQNMSHAG